MCCEAWEFESPLPHHRPAAGNAAGGILAIPGHSLCPIIIPPCPVYRRAFPPFPLARPFGFGGDDGGGAFFRGYKRAAMG